MKVGTIVKLKVDCLNNKAGTLGVVFNDYGDGFQAIFKNGRYDGFSLLDEGMSLGASPDESDYFLEEVGFEESLAGYRFINVMQVLDDYRKGLFNIAWSEKWQQPEAVVKCPVYPDGNRPPWLRFKRNVGGDKGDAVRCCMLSAAEDFADFAYFEYATLGKSIHPRWIQDNITLYPKFVVFHKKL